jgi:NADP-dependent 3-hydroxy acid dehydrogenase YdfG
MSAVAPSGVLADRTAVVFGATGWIGRAVCRDLVAAGARVVAVGRNPDRLDALVRDLGAADRVQPAVVDVTAQLEVDDARAAAVARFGHVDLVVVSSGVLSASRFEDGVPADWAEMIDVNLRGLLYAAQTFAEPLLDEADRGRSADLVLIGAVSTDARPVGLAVFSALSAAISQLARTLRHEYGPRGLRVHVLEPGFAVGRDDDATARESSDLQPDAIAAVVTLAAALPSSANLAEVRILPTRAG